MSQANRKIVEDSPTMRSVQMMPAMSLPPPIPMGRSFVQKSAPKAAHNNDKAPKQEWIVPPLKPVPAIYPLERTNVYVSDATPAQVAARIADCMRQESIAAKFDGDKALAETHCQVEFVVRLFCDGAAVVVECQRRSGCSCSFYHAARLVLRAAKAIKPRAAPKSLPIPTTVPKSSEQERKSHLEEGLEIATTLLRKDRLDANLLAMESLVHISTASERSSAAKQILSEHSDTILSLILSRRLRSHDEEDFTSDIERENYRCMRRHALTLLANCLESLDNAGELSSSCQKFASIFSEDCLCALVKELTESGWRPHDACQASRCLRLLVSASSEAKRCAAELGCVEAAALACDEGVSSHVSLERESRRVQLAFSQ